MGDHVCYGFPFFGRLLKFRSLKISAPPFLDDVPFGRPLSRLARPGPRQRSLSLTRMPRAPRPSAPVPFPIPARVVAPD